MALIRQGLGLGDVRLQRGDLALSVCYNKIDDVLVAQCDRPDVLNIAPARHLQATRGSGILTTEMPRLIKLTGEIPDPCASVIFVHGLGGGPRDTWQRASDPKSFWPLWLAEDIKGLAVYSVKYEAPISRWRGEAMHLTDRGTSLLARLSVEPDLQRGPLILIGHSLGGLVIKQLLRTADVSAI